VTQSYKCLSFFSSSFISTNYITDEKGLQSLKENIALRPNFSTSFLKPSFPGRRESSSERLDSGSSSEWNKVKGHLTQYTGKKGGWRKGRSVKGENFEQGRRSFGASGIIFPRRKTGGG